MRRGDEASGASGLTIGILEAVDVEAQTIRVGGRIFRVGYRERLQQFPRWVGQRVTVIWDEFGDRCEALTVVIERP